LQSIGYWAFNGSGVANGNFPAGLTYIGPGAFTSTGLTSAIIPLGVTTINPNTFTDCTSLSTVSLPITMNNISQGAFYGCTNLGSIDIPDTVTSIGSMAFYQCGFSSLDLPANLTYIGDSAFEGSALASVDIPSGVTFISFRAFAYCPNLAALTLHSGLLEIGTEAFAGCPLISLVIPDTVITINPDAFTYGDFTSITLPASVAIIADYAFARCANLTGVTVLNPSAAIGFTAFHDTPIMSHTGAIYGYKDSSAHAYASTNGYEFEYPELSVSSAQIYEGGRFTVTPNHTGGTWSYPGVLLSGDTSSGTDAQFTALRSGTERITYLYHDVPAYLDITIRGTTLPNTGQDFTPVMVLLAAAAVTLFIARIFAKRRVQNE